MVVLSAGEVIIATGAVVSIVKSTCGGSASTTFPGDLERAVSVCGPSVSAAVVNGDVQAAKPPPSTWHSIAEPAIEVDSRNDGVVSLIGPLLSKSGVIVVTGAAALASGPPPPPASIVEASAPRASMVPPASVRASAPVGASIPLFTG